VRKTSYDVRKPSYNVRKTSYDMRKISYDVRKTSYDVRKTSLHPNSLVLTTVFEKAAEALLAVYRECAKEAITALTHIKKTVKQTSEKV
jgi:hypothetical protein